MRKALLVLALLLSVVCQAQYASTIPIPFGSGTGIAGCIPPSTYATFDPAKIGPNLTLSGGNLTVNNSVIPPAYNSVFGTRGASSGKFYCTLLWNVGSVNAPVIGIGNSSSPLTNYVGSDVNGWGYYAGAAPNFIHSGAATGSIPTATQGDIIMMAVDISAGKVWWGKNGTWYNSGNPALGTNPIYTGLSGTLYPISSPYGGVTSTINFGATTYSYPAPTGFCYW